MEKRTAITAIPDSIAASPWKKRLLTCLLARYMPAEGVDEMLEASIDCWNFYVDRTSAPAIQQSAPSTVILKVTETRTRPGITLDS